MLSLLGELNRTKRLDVSSAANNKHKLISRNKRKVVRQQRKDNFSKI